MTAGALKFFFEYQNVLSLLSGCSLNGQQPNPLFEILLLDVSLMLCKLPFNNLMRICRETEIVFQHDSSK